MVLKYRKMYDPWILSFCGNIYNNKKIIVIKWYWKMYDFVFRCFLCFSDGYTFYPSWALRPVISDALNIIEITCKMLYIHFYTVYQEMFTAYLCSRFPCLAIFNFAFFWFTIFRIRHILTFLQQWNLYLILQQWNLYLIHLDFESYFRHKFFCGFAISENKYAANISWVFRCFIYSEIF